jgi:hypothetical protein
MYGCHPRRVASVAACARTTPTTRNAAMAHSLLKALGKGENVIFFTHTIIWIT